MKRFLRHPAVNAVCISLFTAYYALIFLVTSGHIEFTGMLYYSRTKPYNQTFWNNWSAFLAAGHQKYLAYALVAVTIFTVVLLILRPRPYDEYHTSLLIQCLAVAVVLTLIAIAVFYLIILSDPNGVIEKFTLFIVVHWAAVVLCDLAYVILCRWNS